MAKKIGQLNKYKNMKNGVLMVLVSVLCGLIVLGLLRIFNVDEFTVGYFSAFSTLAVFYVFEKIRINKISVEMQKELKELKEMLNKSK